MAEMTSDGEVAMLCSACALAKETDEALGRKAILKLAMMWRRPRGRSVCRVAVQVPSTVECEVRFLLLVLFVF